MKAMKKYIASKLPAIAKWCGVALFPQPSGEVYTEAMRLALVAQETYTAASGEYKRHQVFAKLIKTFPEASKRDLGMAIEMAVKALP